MEGEPSESNLKSEPLRDSAPCQPQPISDHQSERTISPLANSHDEGSNPGDIHDGDIKIGEDGSPDVDGQMCKVCGDNSVGSLFGSVVCVPCKTFFLRYGSDHQTFKCKYDGNCTITPANRTRCKYCRYHKCNAIGMWKKVRPVEVQVREGQQACVVCSDIANGVHFGAITCEGCKKFFRRGLLEHDSYSCKNEKKCPINPQTRNSCRFCRYQKCLQAGMSREAIQMGRPSKTRTEALKFLRVNNNNNNKPQQQHKKPKKRNSSNSTDVMDEPEVDDEDFEGSKDGGLGGLTAPKKHKSSTSSNENPTPHTSLQDSPGFEPDYVVSPVHGVFYKKCIEGHSPVSRAHKSLVEDGWDGVEESGMKNGFHAKKSSISQSIDKLPHATDSSSASREEISRGQQPPSNGTRRHTNGDKKEDVNDRDVINNFRSSIDSDRMHWMTSNRLQFEPGSEYPPLSYKTGIKPSTYFKLQSGMERNYRGGHFHHPPTHGPHTPTHGPHTPTHGPHTPTHGPHNGVLGFVPPRQEEYYFRHHFSHHLNGGNYHQNHNPYYVHSNTNNSTNNNMNNNINNNINNNMNNNINNRSIRPSLSATRKNDDPYKVPAQDLNPVSHGGVNSPTTYDVTLLSRISPVSKERTDGSSNMSEREIRFQSKVVENQFESHSREFFHGNILGSSHSSSSSSSSSLSSSLPSSSSSVSHVDVHASRILSSTSRSRPRFSTSATASFSTRPHSPSTLAGDRSSPYSSVMMLLNNCQLFSEACKNPFHHPTPSSEALPPPTVQDTPPESLLCNSSVEEYPSEIDPAGGDQGRNAQIIRLLDSPEQSRITETYWLKHDELPDESLMLNDKHFDVINQIVLAYEKFLKCGTNINITLKKELESWNQHSQVPLQGSISLPEWIQVKVIPVYTYTSITYCKSLPGFLDLSLNDQATLIRLGQTQSRIMLAAVHWFDPQKKNFEDFLSWRPLDLFKQRLITYADKMHKLQLDFIESALLNALIIIAADYPGLENPSLINNLRQRILLPFRAYTTAKFGTPNHRLERLFRHIPETRQLGFLHYKMTMRASLRAEEVEKQGD